MTIIDLIKKQGRWIGGARPRYRTYYVHPGDTIALCDESDGENEIGLKITNSDGPIRIISDEGRV